MTRLPQVVLLSTLVLVTAFASQRQGAIDTQADPTEAAEASPVGSAAATEPFFAPVATNDPQGQALGYRVLLDTSFEAALLSWQLNKGALPATADALLASRLLPFLPVFSTGVPARLTFGDATSPLDSDELRLVLQDPQLVLHRLGWLTSSDNPDGMTGGLDRQTRILDRTVQLQQTYRQMNRTAAELASLDLERRQKGRAGLSGQEVLLLSSGFNERRLWCLRQVVKEMLLMYRNGTGTWPSSWQAVEDLLRVTPAPGFFASTDDESTGMVAEVLLDPTTDAWAIVATPAIGSSAATTYWIYEDHGAGTFGFQVLSRGVKDPRFEGKAPEWRSLVKWSLTMTPE